MKETEKKRQHVAFLENGGDFLKIGQEELEQVLQKYDKPGEYRLNKTYSRADKLVYTNRETSTIGWWQRFLAGTSCRSERQMSMERSSAGMITSGRMAHSPKNNIRTVDDLMGQIEKCKRVRSDAVYNYNESGRKIKDLAQLVDNYKLYHPYAAAVRTYESLTGKKKEAFARKHPELDAAYAYRASFKSLSGSAAITPKKWQAALEEAKQGRMKLRAVYEQADRELSELSDILDKVLKAEESRQREREQDVVLQAGQHAREGQQKRRKEHGMSL